MAITQISQITVRKGLEQDLPQLAGGEFGWAIDTSNLYIGNGTLQEGAPAVGVTQILTAGSSVIQELINYQYSGPGNILPRYTEVRSFSDKLQETVSVKDFFAVGDGVTDDSLAFQTAMSNLYSFSTDLASPNSLANPRLRKVLFVPAGNYVINQSLNIPSFCTLRGEGANSSLLILSNANSSVTTVSSILNANNSQVAQNIALQDLGIVAGANSAVRIINADTVALSRVAITGSSSAGNTAGVELVGSSGISNIVVTDCSFVNLGNGVYAEPPGGSIYQYVSIRDSVFGNVGNGVQIPDSAGAVNGISATRNIFRNVTETAQRYGTAANGIVSGENIHINVGNLGNGSPTFVVIDVYGDNFSSFGDIFDRGDSDAETKPRILIHNSRSVAMDGTESLVMRNRRLGSADLITLENTDSSGRQSLYTFPTNGITGVTVTLSYTLSYNSYRRQGTASWTTTSIGSTDTSGFSEEYNDNSDFAPADAASISFSIRPEVAPYGLYYYCNVATANLIYSVDSFNSQN